MKNFMFIVAVIFLGTNTATASDWYYDYKDGKRYVCTFDTNEECRQDSDCSNEEICRSGRCERNPMGSIRCAERAYQGPFSRDQAAELCQGATNTNPAECGIAAYKGPFSLTEAVTLCRNAPNATGPASCAIKAYRGPFSLGESVQLCRGAAGEAPADCAIEAYRGPFSREEAVRMCSNQTPVIPMNTVKAEKEKAAILTHLESIVKKELKFFNKNK